MVCVRFLRTQQCAKSQCLLVLDQMAGQVPSGVCLVVLVLDSFGKYDSCRDLSVSGLATISDGCRLTLTESLILAQDERWRRA